MQAKVLTDLEHTRRSQALEVSMHAVSTNERLVHYWGTAYDRPRPCTYCGRVHTKGRCPAYGRTCRACGRKNHFESCCRGMARVAPLHAINTEPEDFLMTVSTDTDLEEVNATSQMFPSRIFATMQLEGEPITFQLDCGATCNVVRRSDLPREARITSTNTCLKMYNGTTETPLGSYEANVYNTANRKAYRLLFLVEQSAPTAILGAQACQEMDLLMVRAENISQTVLPQALKTEGGSVVAQVELEDILEEYSDVFSDQLGTFQEHVHLHVDHEISLW